MISAATRALVRTRANECCEYCGLLQSSSLLTFHVEHVIPRKHGGQSVLENLAFSCPNCNWHKGSELTGLDPDSGDLCRLFHPREDAWEEHFQSQPPQVIGLTPKGRTTVWVLAMNEQDQLLLRSSHR
jgi:hypothetical protein